MFELKYDIIRKKYIYKAQENQCCQSFLFHTCTSFLDGNYAAYMFFIMKATDNI